MIQGTNIQPKSNTTAGAIMMRAVDLDALVAIAVVLSCGQRSHPGWYKDH